jgi:hypothetical protein
MTYVNQNGDPVFEDKIWHPDDLTDEEAKQLLIMLLEKMNLRAVRTNATKHGNTELRLEEIE